MIEEIPVNCQEETYEKLIESLKITIREALEFNKSEALEIAGSGYREEKIRITAWKGVFSLNISRITGAIFCGKVHVTHGSSIRQKIEDQQFRAIMK